MIGMEVHRLFKDFGHELSTFAERLLREAKKSLNKFKAGCYLRCCFNCLVLQYVDLKQLASYLIHFKKKKVYEISQA